MGGKGAPFLHYVKMVGPLLMIAPKKKAQRQRPPTNLLLLPGRAPPFPAPKEVGRRGNVKLCLQCEHDRNVS
jgi:hypothetical protein